MQERPFLKHLLFVYKTDVKPQKILPGIYWLPHLCIVNKKTDKNKPRFAYPAGTYITHVVYQVTQLGSAPFNKLIMALLLRGYIFVVAPVRLVKQIPGVIICLCAHM